MFLLRSRASQKSGSRSEQPSESLTRLSGEATQLASDIGDVVQIHQGQHDGIENSQHLGHGIETHATSILAQRDIAAPVEAILHGPMCPVVAEQGLGRAALWRERGPAIGDFDTVLPLAGAFALHAKDLPHLTPVPLQKGIEIGTRQDVPTFQPPMTFFDLFIGLPCPPISVRIFKKKVQIRVGRGRIVFDDDHHIPAESFDVPPKLVIALGGIRGENAPLAQSLS